MQSLRRAAGPCLAPAGVALALAAGCAAFKDPLAPALAGEIRPGLSPAEVQARLGGPSQVIQAPSGHRLDVFEDYRTIFSDRGAREREEDLQIRVFSVRYAPAGGVEQTMYHRGIMPGLQMLYSRSLGLEITPEMVNAIRPQTTTRAELERRLGPPVHARLEPVSGTRLAWAYQYVEAAAVTTAFEFRSLEIILDEADRVVATESVNRVFPSWRR